MQNIYMEMLMVALRSVLAFISLFIIARLTGERQISQLTFYDYIVGITIGSIAAMAVETDISFWLILISMVVFGGLTVLISFITNKSIVLRRICTGKPTIMIYNGKIIKKNLNKHHYDINDLLLECRSKGYFDISQIQCAIMESNGQMSILPKAKYHPLTPADTNEYVKENYLYYSLIIDGKILERNLKAYGKDSVWLKKQLKNQNVTNIKDVLLCVGDNEGNINIFKENEQLPHNDFFE